MSSEQPATGAPAPSPDGSAALDALHRKIHRSFLIAIGVSAVACLLAGFSTSEPALSRTTTFGAVGLGLGCVVLRRLSTSPMIGPAAELRLGIAGLACGALLALVGVFVAWDQEAARTGLAYTGGAFILCARPPIPAHLRVRRRPVDGNT